MKSVVVTGVSSGIGLAVVKNLCAQGLHVFGSVRKAEVGQTLKAQFGTRFTPLLFDVADEFAVSKAADEVRTALKGQTLLGLVNNAGIAVPAPLLSQSVADFRLQIEVNVIGQIIVTQAFAPLLGIDKTLAGPPGRIVMIGSDSGRIAAPFLGAYSASKHAIEGVADSLRRELLLFGVDVSVIEPGFVATEIWDKAEALDLTPYLGTPYEAPLKKLRDYMLEHGRKGVPPERIANAVHHALCASHPKTRYVEVQDRLVNWTLPLMLPRRTVDRLIGKQLGLLSTNKS